MTTFQHASRLSCLLSARIVISLVISTFALGLGGVSSAQAQKRAVATKASAKSIKLSYAQQRSNVRRWTSESNRSRNKITLLTGWSKRRALKARADDFALVAAMTHLEMPGVERIANTGKVGTGPERSKTKDTAMTKPQRNALVSEMRKEAESRRGYIANGQHRILTGGKKRLEKDIRALEQVASWEAAR